ncbi:hypothetical protein [Methylococcus mesophilus]|uniref:hypothetical protein n=1 Tax=Methylococcus mesophilus TaxID=2993564 RepID=UPI00224A6EA4|nr:hypothetical protein [Methylococcus mesophilus]UZR29467.1 hypothetical protein OOT43_02200 [Methylococcus mesophilus]
MSSGGGGAMTPQITAQETEYANVLQNILGASNAIAAPVEKFAVRNMKALDTPLAYNSAGGLGLSHAVQQMAPMQQRAMANTMAAGAAPGSGRFMAAQTQLGLADAKARAQGSTQGRLGHLDKRLGLMNAAVGAGRQRLGSALDTFSGLSDKANAWERQRAKLAQANASSGANWGQIAGMVGGAALGAMTGGAGLALTAAALGGGLGSGLSNATR